MARKTRTKLADAATLFVEEIVGRYPGISTEVMDEAHSGYDLWISVRLPPEMWPRESEVLDATIDVSDKVYDETGVTSYATVTMKQASVVRNGSEGNQKR